MNLKVDTETLITETLITETLMTEMLISETLISETLMTKMLISETYYKGEDMNIFSRKSESLFILDGCLCNAIFILTTGTILSGYAYYLGANEKEISIIAMLPTLLNVTQIFSVRLFRKKNRNKRWIITSVFLHRFGLGCMFMIPFLNITSQQKVWLLAFVYGIAYFFYDFVATGMGEWMLHSIDRSHEGVFLGVKDSLSLVALTTTSLIAGYMLDHFKILEQEAIGFMIVGLVIIIFSVINYIELKQIEEVETPIQLEKKSILQDIAEPFGDSKFRKVIILYGFWNVSLYICNSFFAIYMVGYLELPYFFIMLMNMLSCVSRVLTSSLWGKLADRISWFWVNRCSILFLAISVCSWVFVGNENYVWILPINQVLAGIAWGGITISIFNIQYKMAPVDKTVQYVSANTAMTSVIGFFSTLVGVELLEVLPTVTIGGSTVYAIQWVILLSGVLMIGVVAYSKKYLQ